MSPTARQPSLGWQGAGSAIALSSLIVPSQFTLRSVH
jgi:hypothetical protein